MNNSTKINGACEQTAHSENLPIGAKINGKWGFIDKTGKWVIKPQFEKVSIFQKNGLASVTMNEKFGFIDKTGKWIVQPQFDSVSGFAENGFICVQINEKWGLLTKRGNGFLNPHLMTLMFFKQMA